MVSCKSSVSSENVKPFISIVSFSSLLISGTPVIANLLFIKSDIAFEFNHISSQPSYMYLLPTTLNLTITLLSLEFALAISKPIT